ncbi:MAG: ABC transporter ATP-binding protein [Candidatus Micrarchaeota archaeon]
MARERKAQEGTIMRVEDLTLSRGGEERILEHISFDVRRGEFLSIIGSSGAGKTTLLQALAGLLAPADGRVYLHGRELRRPTARIGLVYQDYALFPWRTALGNVEFGLDIRGVPNEEKRQLAEEALDLMGILEHRDKYPVQLSGGMQQRVAIARVLVNKPEVLMLDEAFSALDVQTRRKLEEQLLQIQAELGITVILVTHLVEQALSLSDRAIIVNKGRVEKVITLEGGKPRNIDEPRFRELLRETEAMIKPTPKLEVFVKDLQKMERSAGK